ncbi:hypothetical protein FRC02_002292 [Tulasnella sp. 418]|nr:hypothetical protein FRC02_002292 [Tulasnella sp. 418]
MALSHFPPGRTDHSEENKVSHPSGTSLATAESLFPSDHHFNHALAKALYKGERRRQAPANIEVIKNPVSKGGSPDSAWTVKAVNDGKSELLWLLTKRFKTWTPGSGDVWRLQLMTISKDQGWFPMVANNLSSEQSWFEFGIRCHTPDSIDSTLDQGISTFNTGAIGTPKLDATTGSELRWRSHNNFLFGHNFRSTEGIIIKEDHELWRYLEPNDRLAVYMCAQGKGYENHCIDGSLRRFKLSRRPGLPLHLIGMILRMAGIMAPHPRILKTEYVSAQDKELGLWKVEGKSSVAEQELWMVTEILPMDVIQNIAQVQLTTYSRDQGWGNGLGGRSYTWFSLGVFQRRPGGMYGPRFDTELWISHRNKPGVPYIGLHTGKLFSASEEPLNLLRPGDRLVVWMHAQFRDWVNYCKEGKLFCWEYFEPTLLTSEGD